jgi:Uma2 family endonuclease
MLPQFTADQFLERRFELPDAGQWAELVEGVPVFLDAPDLDHGNTLLNLSKAVAAYVQETERGYACFDVGLLMAREPDTIRFPAMCYFVEGERFAEADKPFTDAVPVLVVELASTSDRRRHMDARVQEYLAWGVPAVWVIDSRARSVVVSTRDRDSLRLSERETLRGDPWLAGFQIRVADLFAEPAWWAGK